MRGFAMTEKMKPSGIAWIGDIPQDWNIKRVKYLASLKGRIGWQGLTSDEYIDEGPYLITGIDFQNGGIDWNNCVHISEERWAEAPEIHIQNGDLLITKDGTVGKVAIVSGLEGKASLNSGVLLIRTNPDFDKRFLFWVLQSEEFWTWFRLKNAGNSTIIHLYQGDFAEFSYTFPNTAEQRAIADFLDAQCTKIDSVIADIEKQIETLQKYKKSLITEAVTKGLNRSVPMKDSGVEWIGDIPETWGCKKLKYIISESLQYGANEAGEDYRDDYPRYIRITDITEENSLKDEGKLSLSPDVAAPYILMNGDILFARSGATVGKTFFYTEDCGLAAFAGYLIRARINSEMALPRFVYYSTLGIGYENWKNTVFTQATIQNIGADKYAQFFVTLPQIDEQKSIVEYLDTKCVRIDDIIKNKQQQLVAVQRHKKSLIYEYVTGKKRVTEVN
jgi:type I restriction enzyme S subunit